MIKIVGFTSNRDIYDICSYFKKIEARFEALTITSDSAPKLIYHVQPLILTNHFLDKFALVNYGPFRED